MKDTHVLYAIGILALIAIAAVFVGYATDTLPTNTPRQIITTTTSAATDTTLHQKKDCHCCKERMAKVRAHLEKFREQRKAAKAQE